MNFKKHLELAWNLTLQFIVLMVPALIATIRKKG